MIYLFKCADSDYELNLINTEYGWQFISIFLNKFESKHLGFCTVPYFFSLSQFLGEKTQQIIKCVNILVFLGNRKLDVYIVWCEHRVFCDWVNA